MSIGGGSSALTLPSRKDLNSRLTSATIRSAESVEGEAEHQQHGACAEQRDRHHDGGDERVAEVLQEQHHHQKHQHDSLDECHQHFCNCGDHRRRDVVGDVVLDGGREIVRQARHLRFDGIGGGEGVGARCEQHRQARGGLAVLTGSELVAHAAELDAGDVAQPDGRAVGIGAQHNRAELLRSDELAFDQNQRRDLLVTVARLDADAARGDLGVLGVDGPRHVVGGQVEADQAIGIDPDAQRALGGIKRGAADAGHAPDFAQHVAHQEIAEPDLVETAVGRTQRNDLEHRAGGLLDQDALLHDGARQPRLDALDAVLHVDRGRRDVGAGHEIRGDLDLAERVAGRFEIQDVVGAVELLFDQPRDAVVEILRRGAGIAGADRDRWRRDDRILRHREERNR